MGAVSCFAREVLNIRELQKLVLGDISGVFIPRRDLSASQRVKLKNLSKRWTGIKLEHLKNCSLSSFSSDPLKGKPGIVVVAIAKNKARFIYEGAKLNLINHRSLTMILRRNSSASSKCRLLMTFQFLGRCVVRICGRLDYLNNCRHTLRRILFSHFM